MMLFSLMSDLSTIKLKDMGLKATPQRQAIVQLLEGNRTHPSANDVYRAVLKEHPQISFATVYNILSRLSGAGKIQELHIDPLKKRFDPCLAPHLHFYCKLCTKIYDIPEDLAFLEEIRRARGHKIEMVQVHLKGVCKACNRKGRR
jgi:Fur family transcriptional regulator, peroxide stress response regulator